MQRQWIGRSEGAEVDFEIVVQTKFTVYNQTDTLLVSRIVCWLQKVICRCDHYRKIVRLFPNM